MFHKKKYLQNLIRKRSEAEKRSLSGLLLDRNERFIKFDSKTNNKLLKKISKVSLGLYPNLNKFYEKLSKWLKIPKNQIFVTEGVSGAIKSLIETLTLPGKHNVIFPYPTFALYPVYCKMFNIKYKKIGYHSNYKLDIEKLKSKIDKKTAIVFLPNPNIPIEGILNLNQIINVAKICKKYSSALVIDEVYYPYGNITALNLIKKFPNIIVMRSFSKSFGLAGTRVGYIVGSEKNINYISKTRTGYETNSISIEIVSFFIDNYQVIKKYQKSVQSGLAYLKDKLSKNNIENNGGLNSNFIFVNLKNNIKKKKIINNLKLKKIYVRGNWPKPFDKGILISGAPLIQMKKFFYNFIKEYK